jgi:hypothetical protein
MRWLGWFGGTRGRGRHGDYDGTRKYVLVYLAFNTIANLLTQREQIACFRNAARHLVRGGRFVVELWVPELRKLPPGQRRRCAIANLATSAWTRTTS